MRTIVTKYETLQQAILQFKIMLDYYGDIMNHIKRAQLRGEDDQEGIFKHDLIAVGLRESLIQRFEYNVDMLWKYIRLYLEDSGKPVDEIKTPKHIVREAVGLGLISEDDGDILIAMIGDRNLSSHIYRQEIAEHLIAHIPTYFVLIEKVSERLRPER